MLPDGGSSYFITALVFGDLHVIIIDKPLVCWSVHKYWWLAGGGHFLISSWWGNEFGQNGSASRWGWTVALLSQHNIIISILGSCEYSWAGAGAQGQSTESFSAQSWSDKWSPGARHILQTVHWSRVHTCEQRHMQETHLSNSLHVYDRNSMSRLQELIETSRGHLGRMRLFFTRHLRTEQLLEDVRMQSFHYGTYSPDLNQYTLLKALISCISCLTESSIKNISSHS